MFYLSDKYPEAVGYAAAAHARQLRKGTNIPYVSHPIAVSALVVEHGGNEVQAIAALLHDVLEDCGAHHGPVIAARFGADVLRIVEGLTDGLPDHRGVKPPSRHGANARSVTSRILRARTSMSFSCRPATSCTTRRRSRTITR